MWEAFRSLSGLFRQLFSDVWKEKEQDNSYRTSWGALCRKLCMYVLGAINCTPQDKWCSGGQGGCTMLIWLLNEPHVPCNNALQLFSNVKILHILYSGHASSVLWLSVFTESSPEVQPLFMHPCAHCVVSPYAITGYHVCSFCSVLSCSLYHLNNTSDVLIILTRVSQMIWHALSVWLIRVHSCIFYVCVFVVVYVRVTRVSLSLEWFSLHAAGPPILLPGKLVVSDCTAVSTLKYKGSLIFCRLWSHLHRKIAKWENDHPLHAFTEALTHICTRTHKQNKNKPIRK